MKRFEIPGVPADAEPIDFEVVGHTQVMTEQLDEQGEHAKPQPFTEKFRALPLVPAGALIDLVSMIRYDEQGNRQIQGQAVIRYMVAALEPLDAARFIELINDPVRVVPLETLAEIAMWLSEEQSGHPTEPSST